MTLDAELMIDQFILGRDADAIPDGWPVRAHDGRRLGHHPHLPVAEITDGEGTFLGWLLGWAVGPDGRMVRKKAVFKQAFEAAVAEHGGRFAAVRFAPSGPRFYLGPCGALAAVYSREREVVASSLYMIPGARDAETRLMPELGVPESDHFYPFGLTPRRGIERLIPHHYLDLATWQPVRHWPAGDIPETRDVDATGEAIGALVERQIAGVIKADGPIYMSLTAGRDSRLMAACARDHAAHVTFFTMIVPSEGGRLDRQAARKLARRCGLDHLVLPRKTPTEADKRLHMQRTGDCVGSWQNLATMGQLPERRPVLLGMAGELGRGFHWRRGDTESSRITPADLLDRRGLPHTRAILDRAEAWLAGVPATNALTIWGLYYLEQYLGCWSGPAQYNPHNGCYRLSPYCHREIHQAMMSLPREYRLRCRLEDDLVGRRWPEMLTVPFNWPMGLGRYVAFLKRRAGKLVGKLGATDA